MYRSLPQALFWVATLGEEDSYTTSYLLRAKYKITVNKVVKVFGPNPGP